MDTVIYSLTSLKKNWTYEILKFSSKAQLYKVQEGALSGYGKCFFPKDAHVLWISYKTLMYLIVDIREISGTITLHPPRRRLRNYYSGDGFHVYFSNETFQSRKKRTKSIYKTRTEGKWKIILRNCF